MAAQVAPRTRGGAAIRCGRRARGWSQAQLAAASGIRQSYISELETGNKQRPSPEALAAIGEALALSAVEMEAIRGAFQSQDQDGPEANPLAAEYRDPRVHAALLHVARGFNDLRDAVLRQVAAELKAA